MTTTQRYRHKTPTLSPLSERFIEFIKRTGKRFSNIWYLKMNICKFYAFTNENDFTNESEITEFEFDYTLCLLKTWVFEGVEFRLRFLCLLSVTFKAHR